MLRGKQLSNGKNLVDEKADQKPEGMELFVILTPRLQVSHWRGAFNNKQ